jgi:hypothetical protein
VGNIYSWVWPTPVSCSAATVFGSTLARSLVGCRLILLLRLCLELPYIWPLDPSVLDERGISSVPLSWLELGETLLYPEKSVELISRNRGSLPIYDSWGRESDEFQVDISPFLTGWVGKVMYFRLDASSFSGGPVIQSDEFLSPTRPFIGIDVCIDSTFRWKLRCFRGIIRRSCALLFLSWWIARIYGIYAQICFVARAGCSR